MKKLLTLFALLSVIATPAFAQSFCTCDGTGNVLPFSHSPGGRGATLNRSAVSAFAAAPGAALVNPNSPEATGGGSLGYNELLREF